MPAQEHETVPEYAARVRREAREGLANAQAVRLRLARERAAELREPKWPTRERVDAN
jgi:hypothetical protein